MLQITVSVCSRHQENWKTQKFPVTQGLIQFTMQSIIKNQKSVMGCKFSLIILVLFLHKKCICIINIPIALRKEYMKIDSGIWEEKLSCGFVNMSSL